MEEFASTSDLPRVFASARGYLSQARQIRIELRELWGALCDAQPFNGYVEVADDLSRELWCRFDPPQDLQDLADAKASEFVLAIKSSFDSCVIAAASAAMAPMLIQDAGSHQMPLCSTASEFDSLVPDGSLLGLRPDQVNALRDIQPFTGGPIGKAMEHLANALTCVTAGKPLFAAWASEARPEPFLPEGVEVTEIAAAPAATLGPTNRLATFRISPNDSSITFRGDPHVSFDAILRSEPWPSEPDDNLNARSQWLIVIAEELIDGLERSVNTSYQTAMLASLDELMPGERQTWLPVVFNDEAEEHEAREAIADSDQDTAIFRANDGGLTYLRLSDNGSVIGREIPKASAITSGGIHGIAVEHATRAAAGRWGLPDFVMQPKVIAKGSGIREVGDGTILSGGRGIVLQVKSRAIEGDDDAKAARWLKKNAAHGLRQARGSIRNALAGKAVTLTNLRSRDISFDGDEVDWVPVVVVDHPLAPTGVIPDADPKGPSVVMTRSDWEFLWDQLRSASAIVDYIHRVSAESPLELGAESHRYFELADADAVSAPNELPVWMSEFGTQPEHLPMLPREPASAPDEFGHAIFQNLLEDVADTDFNGDEFVRLSILAMIDRVAVGTRAELGRLLLRRLILCAEAPVGEHRLEHRVMFLDAGQLHLSFTTMTRLTGYHHEIYKTWLLHRRQRFLETSGAAGPDWPWTVGVLITPRIGNDRPWDTSMAATNGPPQFEREEFDRLTPILAPHTSK